MRIDQRYLTTNLVFLIVFNHSVNTLLFDLIPNFYFILYSLYNYLDP